MWQYFQALKGQPVEENENNAQAQPTEIQGMENKGLGVNFQLRINKWPLWFSRGMEHRHLPQQAQVIFIPK